jgi:hypothetical protein
MLVSVRSSNIRAHYRRGPLSLYESYDCIGMRSSIGDTNIYTMLWSNWHDWYPQY